MGAPEIWRLQGERYNLVGEVCVNCDYVVMRRRPVCTECEVRMGETRSDGVEEVCEVVGIEVVMPLVLEVELVV